MKPTGMLSRFALAGLLALAGACSKSALDITTGTAGAGGTDSPGTAGIGGDAGATGAAGTAGGTAGATGTAGAIGTGGSTPSGTATKHRAAATTCSGTPAIDGGSPPRDGGEPIDGGPILMCTQDSECTNCANGHLGRCEGYGSNCVCDQCWTDTDCGATGVCACDGETFAFAHTRRGNVCVRGNCRVDADCGSGGFCSPTVDFGCGSFYGVAGYYCHTPDDQCTNDGDCALGDCRYSPQVEHWVCAAGGCAG